MSQAKLSKGLRDDVEGRERMPGVRIGNLIRLRPCLNALLWLLNYVPIELLMTNARIDTNVKLRQVSFAYCQ